jgi:hypothetical protein
MGATTWQIMALHVGIAVENVRKSDGAASLWRIASRPVHTNQDDAHAGVIPAERYHAVTQYARKPKPRARFNSTLRPRLSRLVRAMWSCSQPLATPSGAIRAFICHDNLPRAAALPV